MKAARLRAMILATGLGSRLFPLTLVRPKALLPYFTYPLLEIVRHLLPGSITGKILVNAFHHLPQMVEYVQQDDGICLLREEKLLGTGGGIARAATHLAPGEALLVHNVDVLHDFPLADLVANWRHDPSWALLLLYNEARFRQVHFSDGRIRKFGDGGNRSYTGVMILSPEALVELRRAPRFSIIDFLQRGIAAGREVRGLEMSTDFWMDAGRVTEYLEIHRRFLVDHAFRAGILPLLPGPPRLMGSSFVGRESGWRSGITVSESVLWDRVWIEKGPVRKSVIADGMVISSPAVEVIAF